MADYRDPWDWMTQKNTSGVPPLSNTLPQIPQVQAPANVCGPSGPGIVGSIALNRGTNAGIDATHDYYKAYKAAQPSPVGSSTPVQGPATGAEAIQAQPLGPLSAAPAEPTTAAAAQGSEIAGSATTAKSATDVALATQAADAGLAVQTAGMTAAELEAFLAQQAAQALLAQQAAAASTVVLV
jgi:hypothetical protein